jgi:small subunit ribosomal protein S8
MLTRLRNASSARHEQVEMPASRTKLEITRILKEEGYIRSYRVVTDGRRSNIRVLLKYAPGGEPVITALERVSRPGLRRYVGKERLPRVLSGQGVAILTTSKGIMTDRRARRLGVGGEVICYVW